MNKAYVASVMIAALASCAPTIPTTSVASNAPTTSQMTPVIWKENTPRAIRLGDYRECDSAAVGGRPTMTDAELEALGQNVDPATRAQFRTRCLTIKGYTVTERRTCTRNDVENGIFVNSRDIETLPPLDTVRCMYPEAGGFVTA
jgi:hypothetical protein